MSDTFPFRVETVTSKPVEVETNSDVHVEMARIFAEQLKKNRKPTQSNLTPVPVHLATRKKRVALALVPMWGPQVAPYGIARLAGLSRSLGLETRCWDINIACYQHDKNYGIGTMTGSGAIKNILKMIFVLTLSQCLLSS